MKNKNYFFPGIIFLFLMGCAGMAANLPDADSPEAKLYEEKCTTCHRVAHPKRFYPSQWEHYVRLMKSNMKNKGMSLAPEDEKVILNYLKKNAR